MCPGIPGLGGWADCPPGPPGSLPGIPPAAPSAVHSKPGGGRNSTLGAQCVLRPGVPETADLLRGWHWTQLPERSPHHATLTTMGRPPGVATGDQPGLRYCVQARTEQGPPILFTPTESGSCVSTKCVPWCYGNPLITDQSVFLTQHPHLHHGPALLI